MSFTAYVGMTIGPRGQVADLGPLYPVLALTKEGVAHGELWRLLTVALVHSPDQIEFFLHLGFNMYALYLVGPVVETDLRLRRGCSSCTSRARSPGSVASFVFSPPYPFAVGASGAIFGLFGVLFVASRVHHPVLARRERAIMTQVGTLIVLNLAIGFGLGGVPASTTPRTSAVSSAALARAHPPAGRRSDPVLDVAGRPGGRAVGWRPSAALQLAGVVVLAGVVAIGIVVGDDAFQRRGADGPSACAGRRRPGGDRGVAAPV